MDTSPDAIISWLALSMVSGLGNIGFRNLLERFGTPESVFKADLASLSKVKGVRRQAARRIFGKELSGDPEAELENARRHGARLITYGDPSYPGILREIHDPPMILYAKGRISGLQSLLIGVVGSRNATHYGLKAAEMIGMGLARRGVGVVSGLARGIDSAAHRGCLRGGGLTVGVLGTGIDIVYPAENRPLFSRLAKEGVLLSEFPVGTPPDPQNFPRRNRIISGLSRGVLVVEATLKSGSLITASLALEQGRDVYAVPGSIDSFKSTGTHCLIKQGAKLVENAEDILDELGFHGGRSPAGPPDALPAMDPDEQTIHQAIGNYPAHIDEIVRRARMDVGRVSAILTRMELKGKVRQLPGKMFVV